MSEEDLEIVAFSKLREALEPLEEEARFRVLDWANRRYLNGSSIPVVSVNNQPQSNTLVSETKIIPQSSAVGGYDDLGEVDDEGNLDLHIRNFKAKSKKDCVNRLVHVVIYIHEKLTGEREIGGPTINKFLEDWRLYDSNARNFLASHKGIKTKGTRGAQRSYYLDNPGKKEAEKYISEIRDDSIQGKFDPTKSATRKRTKKNAE